MGMFLNRATSQSLMPGPRNATFPALPTKFEYWPLLPTVFTGGSWTTDVLEYWENVRSLGARLGFPVSRTLAGSVPPVRSVFVFRVIPMGAPRTKEAMPESCQSSNPARITLLSHSLLALGIL